MSEREGRCFKCCTILCFSSHSMFAVFWTYYFGGKGAALLLPHVLSHAMHSVMCTVGRHRMQHPSKVFGREVLTSSVLGSPAYDLSLTDLASTDAEAQR